ncbi:hypothetical protein BJX63DRAFT_422671 [Aspergillus granulosus]|uniref:Uncharacterized protein n=1 Tax=Aspergillus granulosus TaxID=176169 RepID=A0ABR4H6P6_9EURO
MSGLEVVGVDKTTSQRLNSFRYKERFIADLILALKAQQYFLETDLCVTLQAAGLDKQEIADLLAKPAAKLFEDPEIAIDVQKCLGDGYRPYIATVAKCERILFNIAKHIQGLTSTEVRDGLAGIVGTHPVNNGRYEISKKIKELNDATKKLRRVRKYSALRVNKAPTLREVARYASTLKDVREYAHRRYKAISGRYVNGCHDEHETFLFLRSRSEAMEKRQQKSLKQAPVQFSLAFPPAAPISNASLSCYITEIKVKHEDVQLEPMMGCPSSTSAIDKIVLPATTQKYFRPNHIHTPKWTLNQRISLSFNIASSNLQLYSTHWLAEPLTSKSIHLQETTMTNTDFPSAKRSLLDLGVLWHFRTLELYAAKLQVGVDESFGARYDIARKWLDVSAYFMLSFYLGVVTRCIECTFVTSGCVPHWDDMVFRKSVCEYVLIPLWEICPPEFR